MCSPSAVAATEYDAHEAVGEGALEGAVRRAQPHGRVGAHADEAAVGQHRRDAHPLGRRHHGLDARAAAVHLDRPVLRARDDAAVRGAHADAVHRRGVQRHDRAGEGPCQQRQPRRSREQLVRRRRERNVMDDGEHREHVAQLVQREVGDRLLRVFGRGRASRGRRQRRVQPLHCASAPRASAWGAPRSSPRASSSSVFALSYDRVVASYIRRLGLQSADSKAFMIINFMTPTRKDRVKGVSERARAKCTEPTQRLSSTSSRHVPGSQVRRAGPPRAGKRTVVAPCSPRSTRRAGRRSGR